MDSPWSGHLGQRLRSRLSPRARTKRFSELILERKAHWEEVGWSDEALVTFDRKRTKELASAHGLRSPKTLMMLDKIDELPPVDQMPESFVLKPLEGWSSNGVFLIRNGCDITTHASVSREDILRTVDGLGSLVGSAFLVEELLENWDARPGAPLDFKFYNFGSRTAYIDIVERNSLTDLKRNRHWFLDDQWRPLGFKVQRYQDHAAVEPPIPPFAHELLAISQRIARQLKMFVRVDLYASSDGPTMGELTANPHGGRGYTDEADLWLGSLWRGTTGAR